MMMMMFTEILELFSIPRPGGVEEGVQEGHGLPEESGGGHKGQVG